VLNQSRTVEAERWSGGELGYREVACAAAWSALAAVDGR